jgi:hypothetical protein
VTPAGFPCCRRPRAWAAFPTRGGNP